MKLMKIHRVAKCFFALLILVFVQVLSGCAQTDKTVREATPQPPDQVEEWKLLSSNEGRFTILLPGTPSLSKSTINTAQGQVEVHSFDLSSGVDFHIAYFDYPDSGAVRDVKSFFAGLSNGAVRQLNGTLLKERPVYLPEGPGWDYQAEFGDKSIIWARSYLIRSRLYQLSVVIQTKGVTEATMRDYEAKAVKFLKSFKPVPPPQKERVFGEPEGKPAELPRLKPEPQTFP